MTGGIVAQGRRLSLLAIPLLALLAVASPTAARASSLSFSTVYVDNASGGGEPEVIYSHSAQDLVYSAHEGTTLTDSSNFTGGTNCDIQKVPPSGYLCSYDNQVNIWFSNDAGQTWTKSLGNPTATGFSDPSLSEDACTSSNACNIYDTGINLVNDALYASADGGHTWVGTPVCPPTGGDRPWLAGGQYGEVFMASNITGGQGAHTIYHGTVTQVAGVNATVSCATTGIIDSGGAGQIYFNHHDGNLIEPKSSGGHLGIGVLPNASQFNTTFLDHAATGPANTPHLEHWPAIAISTDTDVSAAPNGTIYLVYDNEPRDSTSANGCSGLTGSALGGSTLLQGEIRMAYTQDEGLTWSTPVVIANSGGTVQWPWIAAGANGNVSVVWYQGDQVTDPDCDSANLLPGGRPTNWSIQAASISGANTASPTINRVTAVQNFDGAHPGGTIHVGKMCEGGTTCALTGEDRRLGDYFTNALDQNGCVMIASGDTIRTAQGTGLPLPNSLPLYIHQVGGQSLTTGADCSLSAIVPETRWVPVIVALGAVLIGVTAWRRRRPRGGAATA